MLGVYTDILWLSCGDDRPFDPLDALKALFVIVLFIDIGARDSWFLRSGVLYDLFWRIGVLSDLFWRIGVLGDLFWRIGVFSTPYKPPSL